MDEKKVKIRMSKIFTTDNTHDLVQSNFTSPGKEATIKLNIHFFTSPQIL
jgi:hypothetical protein